MDFKKQNNAAFTLVEMLGVIAIIVMMAGLAGVAMKGVVQSQRTEEAGRTILSEITRARQTASSKNENVEIRFIKKVRPNSGSTTPQFWQIQSGIVKSGTFTPIKGASSLPQGMALALSSTLSPILTSITTKSSTTPAYDYVPIGVRPSGMVEPPTGLLISDRAKWCVTLVPEPSIAADSVADVKDFITIQIDPLTTRARSFRP